MVLSIPSKVIRGHIGTSVPGKVCNVVALNKWEAGIKGN